MARNVSDLMTAMRYWIDADDDLRMCYENCDSSPGYRCHHYAECEEKARNEVGAILNEIIDQRISEKTGAV